MLLKSSGKLSDILRGKGTTKFDGINGSRLMSHIYETPVETVVDLIARILSVCVNIKKYTRYICTRTQLTLCITSGITLKPQAASSTALVNYSIIFPLKFTTINYLMSIGTCIILIVD